VIGVEEVDRQGLWSMQRKGNVLPQFGLRAMRTTPLFGCCKMPISARPKRSYILSLAPIMSGVLAISSLIGLAPLEAISRYFAMVPSQRFSSYMWEICECPISNQLG
jgi:hypothetical protein